MQARRSSPSSLTRRSVLASAAAVGLAPAVGRGEAAPARGYNLIFVHPHGGWDTAYALDPKPGSSLVDSPSGTEQRFGDIPILVDASRPSVGAFFEAWSDLALVVHGLSIRSIAHLECTKRLMTGGTEEAAPDIAAITAHVLGRDRPLPYLMLGDRTMVGPLAAIAGRVGPTSQIKALLDPAAAYPPLAGSGQVPFVADDVEAEAIAAFVQGNAERALTGRARFGYNADRMADFLEGYARGRQLEPFAPWFTEAGAQVEYASQVELALDALESGMSKAVMIDPLLDFDTHTGNAEQASLHETLFAGLLPLVQGLADRPGEQAGHSLLDETIVFVASELSRTPKLNTYGGKDHWPYVSSFVFGGPIAGGRTLGGTDDGMTALNLDLATGEPDEGGVQLRPENLLAGLLQAVGVPPEDWFPDTTPLQIPT